MIRIDSEIELARQKQNREKVGSLIKWNKVDHWILVKILSKWKTIETEDVYKFRA